jgi:hypothetical protein
MDDPHRHRRPPAPPRCQMPRPPVLPPVVVHHGGYALPLRDDRRKKFSCLFITKVLNQFCNQIQYKSCCRYLQIIRVRSSFTWH